jgi:uroporphyrinogen III methyltransferase/synthase
MSDPGKVYLVGAGPGAPELITLKGLECLRQADVIVYDRLVDERLLAEAKPGAEKIYVGKAASRHTLPQQEINSLLVSKAREGKTVIRLKGGDPFVFGRGGEEAEALAAHGVPFEVVPGVSAALAVPAYAGIPVTHRHLASSVAIITGHETPAKGEPRIAWEKIATAVDTLVFLMGMENLPFIVEQLLKHGLPETTPAAIISSGTVPQQRVVEGTLADIVPRAAQENITPPAVIVVGKVVQLRSRLRWFDPPPLRGKRVLVTRTRDQASELSRLLAQQGAEPVELPTIEIEELPDYAELDNLLSRLSQYDWIIFTSANGVEIFFRRLQAQGLDLENLPGIQVCAIGPATAAALEKWGRKADYIPQEYIAESILAGLKERGVSGCRILLPRADKARPELVQGLRQLGATADEVITYRTVPARGFTPALKELQEGRIDIITFTSSSTVRHLVAMLEGELSPLQNATIACIGPITAAAAAELGLRVDVVAEEHTIPGLVRALAERYTINC